MVGRRIWAEGWVWVEDWPSAVVLPGRQPQKRHKCYAGAKSSGAVEGGCLGPEGEHVPSTGRTEDAEGVAATIMAKRHQPGGVEARCQKWAGGGFNLELAFSWYLK